MKYIAEILQLLSIMSVTAGVGIEIIYGAHLGFICITIGGLVFGLSEKLNRLRQNRKHKNKNHGN